MTNRFSNLLARLRRLDPLRGASGATPRSAPIDVAQTIERALANAGLRGPAAAANESAAAPARRAAAGDETIIDVEFRRVDAADGAPPAQGQFLLRSFANAAGTRAYKVYIPHGVGSRSIRPNALVVMLHGCTQSPDDFAAGTRMNDLADRLGMIVVYPQQTGRANGAQCWNWFRPQDQQREGGEPSLIAGIARTVAAEHGIDPENTYVAGLSAGAAMAVILGQTHPDVFAAVGAHSGLAYGVAHDVPSALGAMQGAAPANGNVNGIGKRPAASAERTPTIVFHGDSDRTVAPGNGAAIIEQITHEDLRSGALRMQTQRGATSGGRSYTRQVYHDADETPRAEYWVLHGSGHAWSGGSANGSFTEPEGPDASSEMMRFFNAQRERRRRAGL